MNTTYKVYDKIRALAGDWEMYRNGIKWNTVFYMGDIIRGRIEKNNYDEQYFTIESLEDNNTITFTKGVSAPANTFYYSLDDGATWTSSNDTTSWILQSGGRVKLKATANQWSTSSLDGKSWIFSSSNRYNVYGNTMSIIYGDNFIGQTALPYAGYGGYTFLKMFISSTNLVNAANLKLPATNLPDYCYQSMFSGCTALTTAPELPATRLTDRCYYEMFSECTSLTTAPSLPATTLASSCYCRMFYGCTSLVNVQDKLNARIAKEGCYIGMFRDCTSLVTAPEIKATSWEAACCIGMFYGCTSLVNVQNTLSGGAASCYSQMFKGCTSLITAPQLTSGSVNPSCYSSMFSGCTSLVNVTNKLPAYTMHEFCYSYMFEGCTSLVTAPVIQGARLAEGCYLGMFYGCTSLTTAPELPVAVLVDYCYDRMFYGCRNLNYIKCLATDKSATNCLYYWVYKVAASGNFVKTSGYSWPTAEANNKYAGIPSGWTVQNAS